MENKVIQTEEFNVKESWHYNLLGFNKPSSGLRKDVYSVCPCVLVSWQTVDRGDHKAPLSYFKEVGDCSWGGPEGSLFNSYYTEMLGRVVLLSLDCATYPSSALYNAEC